MGCIYKLIFYFQRVKARIKEGLLDTTNITLNEKKTTYGTEYSLKNNEGAVTGKIPCAPPNNNVRYFRNLSETVIILH